MLNKNWSCFNKALERNMAKNQETLQYILRSLHTLLKKRRIQTEKNTNIGEYSTTYLWGSQQV